MAAWLFLGCEDREVAAVDDEQQHQHIEAQTGAVHESVDEQHSETDQHLDAARLQIEAAIDEAEKFSEQAFRIGGD